MAETQVTLKTNSLAKLKGILNNETMQQNFRNILAENAGAFMASIIELYQQAPVPHLQCAARWRRNQVQQDRR